MQHLTIKKDQPHYNYSLNSFIYYKKQTYKIIIFIIRNFIYQSMKSYKKQYATIDGYSRSYKFTQTFFHHPSRNNHYQTQYQKKRGNNQTNTFRSKKNSQFRNLNYTSSHHILPPKITRQQKIKQSQKRMVKDHSFKPSDPINLKFQKEQTIRFTMPFQCSRISKANVQRRYQLPIQRQMSRSLRHYHSQVGLSNSSYKDINPRSVINNSQKMKMSIQYNQNHLNKSTSYYDDFKYTNR